MNKGFWLEKDSGHLTDGDTAFTDPSKIPVKRSHQWFVDSAEPEMFTNKKQAVQASYTESNSGISGVNVPQWENPSSFESAPNQFINRLFGSETARPVNYTERNTSFGTDSSNTGTKGINEQFGNVASVGLSISHAPEDPGTGFSYGGIRKVKVNQVKDSDNSMHGPNSYNREKGNNISLGQAYDRGGETSFISMGQAYNTEDDSVTLMGHIYNRGDTHIRPMGSAYDKGDDNVISIGHTFSNGDNNNISFGGFQDEADIHLARPISGYDLFYNQPSVQPSETASEKGLESSNANAAVTVAQRSKPKPEAVLKNKSEFKAAKKESPNSFPSNVRSLISTGMLDGVPVKYVSLSREELHGIIKGSGYLCGCQSCNFTKVLNAYEFERHASCKTKHPNNHIYFENGKTIYQIVQELRSTPENLLFDAIQTVTGSPINQKSFRIWKESFQAATRELQRIYGKEEMNV